MAEDFYSGIYNPDVLSCIANLSNDEVFTPPEIANQVLDMLPQELFLSPDTKFLDPACKSGVFLREIAKRLLKARLIDHYNPKHHIFTMARRASGDCNFLDAQTRRCTVYERRPETCRLHPQKKSPRPGWCAFSVKPAAYN